MSRDVAVPHTAGGRQQALRASVSPLKYSRPWRLLCMALAFVAGSISLVQRGAVVLELFCRSRSGRTALAPAEGHCCHGAGSGTQPSPWATLHCNTFCSTNIPSASKAESGLHYLYVQLISRQRSLSLSLDASSLLRHSDNSDSRVIKKICPCMRRKWKWRKINCMIVFRKANVVPRIVDLK